MYTIVAKAYYSHFVRTSSNWPYNAFDEPHIRLLYIKTNKKEIGKERKKEACKDQHKDG